MKKLLVVVDYQNDFIDGALGFPDAKNIHENVKELIKEFKNNDDYIVATMDTHEENYLDTVEGTNLPIKHCIKGTKGWEVPNDIKELLSDCPVYCKNSFGSVELANFIDENKDSINEIYICGLITDICVLVNTIIAKSACSPFTKVKVVRNCVETPFKKLAEEVFDLLKNIHCEII